MLAAAAWAIALGMALADRLPGSLWPLVLLAGLYALRAHPRLARLAVFGLLLLPAAWWAQRFSPHEGAGDVARLAPKRFIRLEGVIATPPQPHDDGWRADVMVTSPRPGRVQVDYPHSGPDRVGTRIRLVGRLGLPHGADNPGDFDYRAFLAQRGVFAVMRAEQVSDLGAAPGWGGARALDALRHRLIIGLGQGLAPRDAALFGSLVLGSGAAPVDPATATAFRSVGLSHLLAASGAQVALLGALILGICRLAGLEPVVAALVTAPFLLLYLGLTGPTPSMLRATIMGLVGLGGLALGRRGLPYAALYFAAIVMLLANPTTIQDLGFQFSFLACYGLVRLAAWEPLNRLEGPQWLYRALLVPMVCELWVMPWQVATFQAWSPLGLPANWLAAPLVELLTPIGLGVAGLGAVWPAAAGFANRLVVLVLHLLSRLVFFLASPSWAQLAAPSLGALALVGIYGALWCGLRRPRWAIACLALALLGHPAAPPAGELRLSFLSVGQGDGCVIRTPGGHFLVVDAGPRSEAFDAGARTVLPYLRRAGCRRIDLMIATHAHLDHVGGLPALTEALPVAEAWDAGQSVPGHQYADLLAGWLTHETPWQVIRPGRTWQEDGVMLRTIAPFGDETSTNGGSIVVMLRYGRFRALLTGDMEAGNETRLLDQGLDPHADVLKVAHHGSRSASTLPWLRAVHPALAVISCGLHNRFGHPHAETLAHLARIGAAIARTDRDGAVLVRTDGTRWAYTTGQSRWQRWETPHPALAVPRS